MTTRTENKIRIRKAAGWILQGHSVSHVVARLAESEGVSRTYGPADRRKGNGSSPQGP